MDLTKTSKFLSYVLRHKPHEIGLTLDENGWANVDTLIELANKTPQFDAQDGRFPDRTLTRAAIEQIVTENDKKRFAFSDDGLSIRASQGHSVKVDLGLSPTTPPEILYHGTATRFLPAIREAGLHSANRHDVHLSADVETADKVGRRHGVSVVLKIMTAKMLEKGHLFFLSANGVWLTKEVPAEHIIFP